MSESTIAELQAESERCERAMGEAWPEMIDAILNEGGER